MVGPEAERHYPHITYSPLAQDIVWETQLRLSALKRKSPTGVECLVVSLLKDETIQTGLKSMGIHPDDVGRELDSMGIEVPGPGSTLAPLTRPIMDIFTIAKGLSEAVADVEHGKNLAVVEPVDMLLACATFGNIGSEVFRRVSGLSQEQYEEVIETKLVDFHRQIKDAGVGIALKEVHDILDPGKTE